MKSNSKLISSVRLFRTTEHPCSYKEDQQAATVFIDPDLVIDKNLNSKLSEIGYRRSGAHLYRPDCELCNACMSIRIPVDLFKPKRPHRRVLNKNKDLRVEERTDLTSEDAFGLYERYISERHRDGDMYPPTREQYEAFIKTRTVDTVYYLFYLEEKLVSVSVVDKLVQGLSAVYTFFDPDLSERSLGKFAILWLTQRCTELELPYLFLGYWVKGCQKMEYKKEFRPFHVLVDGRWVLVT